MKAYLMDLVKEATWLDRLIVKYFWMFPFFQRPQCRMVMIRKYDKARRGERVEGNYIFIGGK